MKRSQLFEQPAFIPIFEDYSHFLGKCIGLTGQKGLLGGILSERLDTHKANVEAYPGDITDITSLEDWFRKHHFDYFFHFAAIVPVSQVMDNPLKAYDVNVFGSYNICKQVIETQPNCWLFLASSSHVYKGSLISGESALTEGSPEEPDTFYGVSKLAVERISSPILDQYGVDYCIGRIFSFSSTDQKEPYLVPTLYRKIEEIPQGGTLEIINPDSVRDIMDANTIIDCVLHLAKNRFKGTLDIGSGKGMSIKEIGYRIMKLLGKKIQIRGVNENEPNSLVANVETLKQVLSEGIH
jgi:nucleoside-diphosphate-sugar epimerase